ncbi:MAG: efflux RND transporter periplasmic adaptor subunit [Campylobacterota bacterium]|nr:efflux RND transporter periplasmic adaptor subunit [Campylobacterota bacterium]
MSNNINKLKVVVILVVLLANISFAKTIELSATVISDNEKYLTSRFMGFIKSVEVNEGDIVKKGKILYSIDSTEIDSKKLQANLAVQMYDNQYQTMKRNYERFKRLLEKGLVSKFEVEQLELGTKNLEDMVKIGKSQVKEVENQYQYLTIKAPNDGVVIKKTIKAGEMAIPGMPAIVLSDLNSLKIKSEISEGDLKNIKIGQKVDVNIASMNLNTVGKIEAIIPSSNPMTHTFNIKISFENRKNVYPGMYAKVYIEIK